MMPLYLSFGSIATYECQIDAERAVECFFPPGYLYEVCKSFTALAVAEPRWTVKAYRKDGVFAGYAHHAHHSGSHEETP